MNDPPRFPPGQGWSYTNTGFIIAGMIIDKVTGNSWRDEARNRIIMPLSLTGTFVHDQVVDIPSPFITRYGAFRDIQGNQGQYIDVTWLKPSLAEVASEIVSTVEDENKFLRALTGGSLLSLSQLTELQTTAPAPDLYPILPDVR
ncbi:hypothetical protein QQS21_010352 [Conoideocrella luteorostrata]|uniref:Beta-lactamase-related domain-containing protein n=1 Tax=Conoideocrella luteorostrata TaxID=1105319 RepID=A0AAJ0CHI1_9HYPO|nr:hypothetical protein QQS21_010352 [Conoideocrella luteorostrata]